MLILDTNHYSEIELGTRRGERLLERLKATGDACFVCVITTEESLRGWLQEIRRHKDGTALEDAYARFQSAVEDFGDWNILPWTTAATGIFASPKARQVRVGTMDLRIASIALSHEALVLTRKLVDFQQVPGLRVENWLD
ncbi:MAG: type II toxin-antitoxin system VapC family toxin [Prosthecobacter sp.]|nr:type II toxin-antitoxin system VapC family toxin [Prosthecobacter sp.]